MDRTIYDAMAVLRASSSQSVGTENGDAIDIGPQEKVIRAISSITVVGSSGTLTLKIQGSATEDGTYYDIPGTNFLDPSDGAVMDAVGEYEVYFKTAFRWIRMVSVVATAAITHEVYLTKAH